MFIFQFEKFVSILSANVVDSNMLIRCLVLSQEHFMSDRFYSGETTISCVAVRLINSCVQMFAIISKFDILLFMCLMINIDKINCFPLLTTGFATGSSKLGTLISNWEQMIFLLYKLINSITVGTLTQVSKLFWTGNLMMCFLQLPENCFQLLSLRSFSFCDAHLNLCQGCRNIFLASFFSIQYATLAWMQYILYDKLFSFLF